MNEQETQNEHLKKLLEQGWKIGYVMGHGTDEPVTNGEYVIADIEKNTVLIPPSSLFEEPIKYENYF